MEDLSALRDVVERARGGSPAAWEALFRRAYPRLLSYATRRLPTPDDARDAVSETFARAIPAIDRFRWNGAGVDAWLYGILRHVVLDSQRSAARRATTILADGDDPGGVPDPLDLVVGAERANDLRRAFSRLSAADRELIELRVVGGLTSEEAAAILGKRPGAVRTAQTRAVARLRKLIEQAEVDGGR